MEASHTKSVEEVLDFFNVDETAGYTDDQVKAGIEKYGPNGKTFLSLSLAHMCNGIVNSPLKSKVNNPCDTLSRMSNLILCIIIKNVYIHVFNI